jgi:hypothetical protein
VCLDLPPALCTKRQEVCLPCFIGLPVALCIDWLASSAWLQLGAVSPCWVTLLLACLPCLACHTTDILTLLLLWALFTEQTYVLICVQRLSLPLVWLCAAHTLACRAFSCSHLHRCVAPPFNSLAEQEVEGLMENMWCCPSTLASLEF